jgi:hypothetical protein
MQLEVEDAKTAARECCILYEERPGEHTRDQARTEDTHISCCVTSNLIADSFYLVESEARNCDSSCAPWPQEGRGESPGLRCSCYNYIGGARWQRSPGVEPLDLEVECAVEDCHFRRLEEQVRNEKHATCVSKLPWSVPCVQGCTCHGCAEDMQHDTSRPYMSQASARA